MEEQIIIRPIRKEELHEAVALADRVFRPDERKSMGDSLPKMFSPSLQQGIGCFHQGQLVSYAGMVPTIVRIGEAQVSAYSYGAVCTDVRYRGQGYASRILAYAKRYAEQAGASLFFVSGELPIYVEAGFQPFGRYSCYIFRARSGTVPATTLEQQTDASSDIGIRELEAKDWLRLYRLAQQRAIAFEQSVWDLADLIEAGAIAAIRHWEQRVWLVSRDGIESGFIVLAYDKKAPGEGEQRHGQIIEWAGSLELISASLEKLMVSLELMEVTLYADAKEQGKVAVSDAVEVSVQAIRNAGTVRVCDPQQLCAEVAPYWRELGIHPDRQPSIRRDEEGSVRIVVGALQSRPLGDAEVAPYLFGQAWADNEENRELREALDDCFPIPLPYTKGLNFV
jgi:predicted N-acetyltransferase YhbS